MILLWESGFSKSDWWRGGFGVEVSVLEKFERLVEDDVLFVLRSKLFGSRSGSLYGIHLVMTLNNVHLGYDSREAHSATIE